MWNPNWAELMSSGIGGMKNINTLVGLLSRLTSMKSVKPKLTVTLQSVKQVLSKWVSVIKEKHRKSNVRMHEASEVQPQNAWNEERLDFNVEDNIDNWKF